MSLFLPQQRYALTDRPWHAQLGPGRPRLLKLVRVGPRLLKLVLAGHCLLNLIQAGRLVIGGCSSGAALVRDGRGRYRYRRGVAGTALSVVVAVLARNVPSHSSAGLGAALCSP